MYSTTRVHLDLIIRKVVDVAGKGMASLARMKPSKKKIGANTNERCRCCVEIDTPKLMV